MARSGGGRSSGGGGGGRGFGGGGNRSFGGRSGGGSYNRSGARGPSYGARPGYSGQNRGFMGFGPRITPIPVPIYGRRRSFFGGGGSGCGCLALPVALVIVVVVLGILFTAVPQGGGSQNSGQVTPSTVERQPLPAGSVNETGYYTDELGWINNPTRLETGMRNFYQKTGVQPYLYITDTIAGTHTPTSAEVETWANAQYDALFTDEAHFLLIFFEYNNSYSTWYVAGNQAKVVMDSEASDILLDYVDNYYYDQNLTDEEMFSKAFNDAGERIMSVTTSPWIPVWIIGGIIVILVIVFVWWRNSKKQKNLEAAQNERVLNTPLETFGTNEADDLAKKYEDKP